MRFEQVAHVALEGLPVLRRGHLHRRGLEAHRKPASKGQRERPADPADPDATMSRGLTIPAEPPCAGAHCTTSGVGAPDRPITGPARSGGPRYRLGRRLARWAERAGHAARWMGEAWPLSRFTGPSRSDDHKGVLRGGQHRREAAMPPTRGGGRGKAVAPGGGSETVAPGGGSKTAAPGNGGLPETHSLALGALTRARRRGSAGASPSHAGEGTLG